MALAKILRPGGKLIIDKLALFEQELLNNLTVGIGVITYNRIDLVKNSVTKINEFTTGKYNLMVADDGSNDGTAEWCSNNAIYCTSGKNKGVVWNKNRALYYLNSVLKCDVTIILEDDCFPLAKGWQASWALSAILWGHVNFAHNRIIKKPGALVSGDGSYLSPFIAKLVTGQCTSCSAAAIEHVGYLNSRFVGYGAGHVEWTEKFVYHGYNGLRGEVAHVFPAINQGLVSEDAPTYKDQAQLERNKRLKKSLKKDTSFKLPWRNMVEKTEFLREISGVLCVDDILNDDNSVGNRGGQVNLRNKVSGSISKIVGRVRGIF
jgi:glycosyltransferase involved in cell wall biosynthesis